MAKRLVLHDSSVLALQLAYIILETPSKPALIAPSVNDKYNW
jgi:hypothetical protein